MSRQIPQADKGRQLKNCLLYLARHGFRVIDTDMTGPAPRVRVEAGDKLHGGHHFLSPKRTTMATHLVGCTVVWDVPPKLSRIDV